MELEKKYNQQNSWFARQELECNQFKGISLGSTTSTGVGHYFSNDDKNKTQGRLGVNLKYVSYEDDSSKFYPGLELGLLSTYKFDNNIIFENNITNGDDSLILKLFYELLVLHGHLKEAALRDRLFQVGLSTTQRDLKKYFKKRRWLYGSPVTVIYHR